LTTVSGGNLKIIIIAAVSANFVIGNDEKIPWHSSEDFKHFKKTTLGFPLIMGRKTFESIGKPLPGRETLIISSKNNYRVPENVKVFPTIINALDYCRSKKSEKVFICGGGTIYKNSMNLADELLITEMKFNAEGNIYFPKINKDIWNVQEVLADNEEFKIVNYKKK